MEMINILYDFFSFDHNYLRNLRLPAVRWWCSIILLFFFSSQIIFSQTFSEIEVRGNKNFSVSNYLNWIRIGNGTKYLSEFRDTINTRIIEQLRKSGYYSAATEITTASTDTSHIKIFINVNEGEPTYINKIHYNFNKTDSAFISRSVKSFQNNIFSSINVEGWIDELLDYYENSGFPFTSIKLTSVFFSYDSITQKHLADLHFHINKNIESRIDRIEISGNTKTKDNVISRAIGINIGELFNQEKVSQIPYRLNRLRYFEPVEEPEFYFNSKNEGVLKISVAEKQTNNFDGVIGFVPSKEKNEKGYFTGYINVSLRNLFGSGRAAYFKWFQETRHSQELEIRYIEPWLFNFPFNIDIGLFQRKQDTTYVQRTFEGKLEYIANEDISASLIFNTQSTIPTEQKNKIFTVYNSSVFTSGINIKIDTRDDAYSPTTGIVLINTYKYTSKNINGPKEFLLPSTKTKVNFQRLELDFGYFTEIFKEQIAAIGIHARELRGSDVELSDLYLLGGTNTLRGYREKQFIGNRILWSNFEYRYLISQRSFLFVFLDSGYYLRNEDTLRNLSKVSGFKIGYGLGLNVETALGFLIVSFALGKEDSFSNGKIHLGIINEF